MGGIRYKGQIFSGAASYSSADDVSYDNSDSGLAADNVQDAVDEINSKIPVIVRHQRITESGSMNNNNGLVTPISYAGYKPIAVVGHEEGINQLVNFYVLCLSDAGQIYYGWRTSNGDNVTNHTFVVHVLYSLI